MPFAWAGAAASVIGTVGSLVKGSGQSGAISQGQQQSNADVQPWVKSGTAANSAQTDLLGLNGQAAADTAMANFQASPGYAYQVGQGLRGVDAGAASKGMLRSGATLKAEQTLGSNLANQDFNNYYAHLNGLSTMGQNSATGQAATDASAGSAQASIYGNAAGQVGNAIGTGLSNPNVQNGLTSLYNNSSWNSDSSASAGSNYNYNPSAFGYTADTNNVNGLITPLS